ncbi:MAG: hypothetical protein CL920_30830 [Deltaproteobacteria bacterium]|nr:hypothetical protein [Deltaproteobacteria bacterium]
MRYLRYFTTILIAFVAFTYFEHRGYAKQTSQVTVKHVKKKGIEIHLPGPLETVFRIRSSVFARPEYKFNLKDFSSKLDDSDVYVATRFRISLEAEIQKQVGFVLTIQDARFWGNGLRSGGDIRFDPDETNQFHREVYLGTTFFEGYLFLERPGRLPLRFEIGRIGATHAHGFILGDPGYIPQGQSFDGMRLFLYGPNRMKTELYWFKIRESVELTDTATCQDGCLFEGDDLAGVRHHFQFGKSFKLGISAHYLQRAPRTGKPLVNSQIGMIGLDYTLKTASIRSIFEGYVQFGTHEDKSLFAFGGFASVAYTLPAPLKPYIGIFLVAASGDTGTQADSSMTFVPVYGKRRKFSNITNMFAPSNIIAPSLFVGIRPTKTTSVQINVAYNFRWADGGVLQGGGNYAPIFKDTTETHEQFLGMEIDGAFKWKVAKFVTFDIGVGAFLPSTGDVFTVLASQKSETFGTDVAMMMFSRIWLKI